MKRHARTESTSLWTCPTCGRRFARAGQAHSCQQRPIDFHFSDKDPSVRDLFDLLVKRLEHTGPIRVDAVKTSIHLISRHHFGGISVRRDYLRVGFLSRRPLDSPRIVYTQVLGANRVEHVVVIRERKDIDAQLLRWLAAAQRQGSDPEREPDEAASHY